MSGLTFDPIENHIMFIVIIYDYTCKNDSNMA